MGNSSSIPSPSCSTTDGENYDVVLYFNLSDDTAEETYMRTTETSSSSSDGSKVGVAYQLPGAYSEAAALKAYPKSETVPCEQFEAAFKALAQYEMTLSKLGIIRVSADDTAGAAQMVASSGKRDSGAVASP
ncbi:hypothetical protein LWI29_000104 [Acer saccharum]|uniref:Uncharacterized protein n=1 Tax=Acer saccharum TaxID=4024 RepID=A0AA39RSW2_ACESA|nr:hypothetical protein LWI29_000104 [Acer saccharum]